MNKTHKVPQSMQQYFNYISKLTDEYCKSYLNDEYAELCRSAIAALCRKRPSPLMSGYVEVWACSIVYALGQANFLFDRSQTPHASPSDICNWFNISKSTAGNKAKLIRTALKIDYYNHEWKLPSKMEDSSFVWMIMVDGYIVDARHLPIEVQQQAYDKGLIPYVPALNK